MGNGGLNWPVLEHSISEIERPVPPFPQTVLFSISFTGSGCEENYAVPDPSKRNEKTVCTQYCERNQRVATYCGQFTQEYIKEQGTYNWPQCRVNALRFLHILCDTQSEC